LNLAIKSDQSESDGEDKSNLRFSLDEDLENDFIFPGIKQIHELAVIESIRSSVSQDFDKNNPKSPLEHRQGSPRSSPTSHMKVSFDVNLNNVKRLRLSDVRNKRSWLDKVTSPFPNDSDVEMKHKTKGQSRSQVQGIIVDYLQQFIGKTALPAISKCEQLQKTYWMAKMEWKKKVDFLEQQNSVLKSELQNVQKTYRDLEKELTSLKKIYSQNQLRFGVNGNFRRSVPDSPNLQRKLLEESLVSDRAKTLKAGNTSSESMGVEAQQEHDMAHWNSNENSSLFTKLEDVNRFKIMPAGNNSRNYSVGGRRSAKDEDSECFRYIKEESGGPFKVSCGTKDLLGLKEKRSPKTVFIDPNVVALSDPWYRQNDNAASTLNRSVLKVKKERRFADSPKMSPASRFQSFDHINQYQRGCERLNKSKRGIAIRSKWL